VLRLGYSKPSQVRLDGASRTLHECSERLRIAGDRLLNTCAFRQVVVLAGLPFAATFGGDSGLARTRLRRWGMLAAGPGRLAVV